MARPCVIARVRFDAERFKTAHGCNPRGFGLWTFRLLRVHDIDGREVDTEGFRSDIAPPPMRLMDAKKWVAKLIGERFGKRFFFLLEVSPESPGGSV